jgi:hypothetical protein
MAKFPALHNGYVILALRSQRVGQRVAWGDGARHLDGLSHQGGLSRDRLAMAAA